MSSREIHSSDRLSFIERVPGGWGVWWEGVRFLPNAPEIFKSRQSARECIHGLKQAKLRAALNRVRLFGSASKEDFKIIEAALGLRK